MCGALLAVVRYCDVTCMEELTGHAIRGRLVVRVLYIPEVMKYGMAASLDFRPF